jgi:threonine/homoserine/homoserine lactone efflux protein
MLGPILLQLLAFVAAAGLLTITPGVDTAMVLRTSMAQGPRAGFAAALGICAGLSAWGVAAAFGITAILAASEAAFTAMKWIGAAYLFYLGIKLLARPRATLQTESPDGYSTNKPGMLDPLRRGFLTNMLNPKVGIFYLTFLPQFIPHGVGVAAFSLLLAGIHVLLAFGWLSLLVAATVPLGEFLAKPRIVKSLDRLTGCVFLFFGLKLAVGPQA